MIPNLLIILIIIIILIFYIYRRNTNKKENFQTSDWWTVDADINSKVAGCEITGADGSGNNCITDGSGNYGDYENCYFTAQKPMIVNSKEFNLERNYDYLRHERPNGDGGYDEINEYTNIYSNTPDNNKIVNVSVAEGDRFRFTSDSYATRSGFKVCGVLDCQYSDWTNYTPCQVKPGATCSSDGKIAGTQVQTRTSPRLEEQCTDPDNLRQTINCELDCQNCVYDESEGDCVADEDAVCNNSTGNKPGTKLVTRNITTPQDSNGYGTQCPLEEETLECNISCPVDCVLSGWYTGQCNATAGIPCTLDGIRAGKQTNTRSILVQPLNGGAACGSTSEIIDCESECTPPAINNECYNTEVENCNQDYCEVNTFTDTNFCAPKLECESNEYKTVNLNKNLICSKCPAGSYLNSNGVCRNCTFGKYSSEGDAQCTDKAECNSSQYVSVSSNPINLSYLSPSQRKKMEFASSVLKDTINISSNRTCVDLEKCNNTQFVSDLDSTATENEQYKYIQNVDKATKRNKYLKENVGSDQCNEFNPTPTPEVYANTPNRFNQYSCSDLTKCSPNQFIANYDEHKVKTSDMYTLDRECSDSSDCLPSTYDKERDSEDYPKVSITKDDETYEIYSRDRDCTKCDDNYYTNQPNMTECLLQPTCDSGKRLLVTLEDFIKSDLHVIQSNSTLAKFKTLLTYLNVTPNQLTHVNEYMINGIPSIDVFFHTESDTSGKIKYINESYSVDVTLFNYELDSNGKLNITAHDDLKSKIIIVYNIYNTNSNSLKIQIKINQENTIFTIKMKNEIPKHRKTECGDCVTYSYISETDHRRTSCDVQSICSPGNYYPGDPPNKDNRVDCQTCADNTYIENTDHRIESCVDQPILPKGQCSVNYDPTDVTKRMTIKNADGIVTYQDLQNHREACKIHPNCSLGELINEENKISIRQCSDINYNYDKSLSEIKYMDEIEHRNQNGKQNPTCPVGQSLYINSNGDERARYKKAAECIHSSISKAFDPN
jgi:hypothetical protein